MLSVFGTIVFVASSALSAPAAASPQTSVRAAQNDSRWDAWLGCWAVDTSGSGHRQSSPGITCVVPVAGSHAVEALTFARGKVVARDRLDSSGEPHAVSGQGCRGFETVEWSTTGHRAMLRSDYVCGSAKGASSTIYAISPDGDWLRVEQVRSGTGLIVSVERRRPVPVIAEVSAEEARVIEDRRMAIMVARAAAATPITTDEVVEAIRVVDAGVVRSWIVASGQTFDLDGSDLTMLVRADVPQSVLEAMMPYERPAPAPALARAVQVYGSAPVYTGPVAYASANASSPDVNAGYDGYDGCRVPMGCNVVPNPYSILNGYGVYPYGYGGVPFSGFNTGFPLVINTGNNNNNNRGNQHRNDGHQNNGHRPVGRSPVGKGGPVTTVPVGSGRRR
jgi:hypothetical protein